ncbi:MAG: pyridoxal-dependent decarboxylase [Anaerolineae bacterium]
MTETQNYHMNADDFRRYGRMVIDWIADYYERIEQFPVLSQAQPGDIRAQLPPQPPQQGEPFEAMLKDMDDVVLPGITHWQSPNFFAYFPANSSAPAVLGDLLSSGLAVQGMLWSTSPAVTEVETHVMDWLAEMLDLPPQFKSSGCGGGVIQDSASSATLSAILAARERITNFESNRRGLNERLVAYASTQTHSSLEKGLKIAGIGADNLRKIPVDDAFAMRPDALAEQIRRDREAGLQPFFVCGTVGTTSSSAVDPLPAIGQICRDEGLWFHVDAAMYGTAAICPEFRHINAGVELADSYTFNPHKWLFTNFDLNAFFVADRAALINTLSILPEYLRNQATESGEVFDYRDWQIPLGRRFRALKLWFVIRHYGVEGLQHHIRRHIELAQQFRRWVDESPVFERLAPAPLTTICFRAVPPGIHSEATLDELNETLLNAVNATGQMFISHTRLKGKYTLRMAIGSIRTEAEHVTAAWELLNAGLIKLIKDDGATMTPAE